jgi:membrane-bound lytic murein transglycosylase B
MRGELAVDDIKKVQEALKDKGHDPGPVDGIVGPQTQKALRSFQVANGIRATGRVDAETAKALGMERGSSSKEPSMAPMTKEPSPKSK